MEKIYLARQSIRDRSGKIIGYELLFRDSTGNYSAVTSNLLATSKVLLNYLMHMEVDYLVGRNKKAFINVDHDVLLSGVLDILDPSNCVIEILETSEVTDAMVEKIKNMHEVGFAFALDDYDCNELTIRKYRSLYQYVSYIKIDVQIANYSYVKKLLAKFHDIGIKVLAEKVETSSEYRDFVKDGFDLFQGYLFGKPEMIETEVVAQTAKSTILHAITLLHMNKNPEEVEQILRLKPDLSYNLIRYLNTAEMSNRQKISNLKQALTLMGQKKLLGWLTAYLYSESGGDDYSEMLLRVAQKRAKIMESTASYNLKGAAFLAGMFSMLDKLFGCSFSMIFKGLPVEERIIKAITGHEGELGQMLCSIEEDERLQLLSVLNQNSEKINTDELLKILASANVMPDSILSETI